MKKFLLAPIAGILFVLAMAFGACSPADDGAPSYPITENTGTLIVFTAPDDFATISLLDYLSALAEEETITFTIEDGMITSVNGTENVTELTSGSYWMIYSDLTEMDGVIYADPAYGTYSYGEATLASCSYGAESMPVVGGHTYALVYEELAW